MVSNPGVPKMNHGILDNIAQALGNTPLVRLSRITKNTPATVLAKVESFNPGGSVKDLRKLSLAVSV